MGLPRGYRCGGLLRHGVHDDLRGHDGAWKYAAGEPILNEVVRLSKIVSTPVIQVVAAELGDARPPHWATCWRWWNGYKGTQCFSKVIDGRHRNGYKTDAVQFSVFEEIVNEIFLTPQRMPGKAVVDAINDRIYRMNQGVGTDQQLTPPAPATVYRWLNKLCRKVVDEARLGKAYTKRELRMVTGTVKVDDLLQRVEVDHTPIDVLVVCTKTRMVLGRPWLTLILDRKSRMVLGFYISFHAPSAYSVLYALRMAIQPKDSLIAAILQKPDALDHRVHCNVTTRATSI